MRLTETICAQNYLDYLDDHLTKSLVSTASFSSACADGWKNPSVNICRFFIDIAKILAEPMKTDGT